MKHNNEFLKFERIGTEKPRSYYIPYSKNDKFRFSKKILNRNASSRFIDLTGKWFIKAHKNIDSVEVGEKMVDKIPVPSCVQMHGYDQIQYVNFRQPIPYDPPYAPKDNPCFHYRKFLLLKSLNGKYYLNFEGVDSGFYLYVNNRYVGCSQISHATSEFDVTGYLTEGKNVFDVVVLKWCASSYLEAQDKFRFTGIFRSVYILRRPEKHITDFKIRTKIYGKDGIIEIKNNSNIDIDVAFQNRHKRIEPDKIVEFNVENAKFWTAEEPYLYNVVLSANGEKILQRVGIRTSEIADGIYKINGKHIKLKGVNRHESDSVTGATVTIESTVKDLKLMKWANINSIRTSHYPDMPEFYDLCDVYGFYVLNEADVEMHGAVAAGGGYDRKIWQKYADCGLFDYAVKDREIQLYERDKNRTCVIIWSLGNESSYGSMFYEGADYIRSNDNRPIHYENIWETANREEYYTERIDMASRMYCPFDFFDEFLADEKERRPLLLCEYSHSMGNSCGDLDDYWKKIRSDDRFMGAFVWEWKDHSIKDKKGYLYGGDFGEEIHDGKFCVDGLVNPDGVPKSNLYELRAVYGGKTKSEFMPYCSSFNEISSDNPVSYNVDDEGRLVRLGNLKFYVPLTVNILRGFIDNDIPVLSEWNLYKTAKPVAYEIKRYKNHVNVKGKVLQTSLAPILTYELNYTFHNKGVDIDFSFEKGEYVSYLPRVGLLVAVDKEFCNFSYDGYGPYESYIDKRVASEYGHYESTAKESYFHYVKPQESGSHYGTTGITLDGAFEISAEKPFSFSIIPYSPADLIAAKHDFDLPRVRYTYVSLDISMSGIGSASCGTILSPEYEAVSAGHNRFRIILK